MRKSSLALLIAAVLLLQGCAKEPPAETLPVATASTPETLETAPAEPEYAVAQVNGVPVILETLSRGDRIAVVEIFDERHYVVKLDEGYGLVEKNLLRLDGEQPFEPWIGYAYYHAPLFDNYRLSGEAVLEMAANVEVEVLDDLGWCLLVRHEGKEGYMKAESLARLPCVPDGQAEPGGGEQAATMPDHGTAEEAVGQDGGEISLRFNGRVTLLSTFVPQKGTVTGNAAVLADGTDVVLGYFDRGDLVPVLPGRPVDGYYSVLLKGLQVRVSEELVRMEQAPAYTEWDGYSNAILSLYEDFWMLGSPIDRLNAGTAVKVLFELENCYLVEADDRTGYAAKGNILPAQTKSSEGIMTGPEGTKEAPSIQGDSAGSPEKPEENTPPAEPTKPAETETPVAPEGNAPNDGSNNSGNESTGETGTADPEWTPPIL